MPIQKFSDFLNERAGKQNESAKSEEYQEYFQAMLKKYGVGDPSELESDEKKKEFFDAVDKGWDEKKSKMTADAEKELKEYM